MDGAIGIEAANEAQVVNALGGVREKRGHVAAALPVLLKLPGTAQQRRIALGELAHDGPVAGRQRLAVVFFERRLGVERIHLARAADHEKKNHRLGFAGEMRRLGGERVHAIRAVSPRVQQRSQRHRAETVRRADQDVAPRNRGTYVTIPNVSIKVHRETRSD